MPLIHRLRAIRALGATKATAAAPRLSAIALHDESYSIRRQSLFALARIVPKCAGIRESRPSGSPSGSEGNRGLASGGEGQAGTPPAEENLPQRPDASVRRAAEHATERIKAATSDGQ